MIELNRRLSRKPRVISQVMESQLVLLNVEDGQYFALDEIGGRIWELCDGTHTASDTVAVIQSEYDAPASMIEGDVLDLLSVLLGERLVEIEA